MGGHTMSQAYWTSRKLASKLLLITTLLLTSCGQHYPMQQYANKMNQQITFAGSTLCNDEIERTVRIENKETNTTKTVDIYWTCKYAGYFYLGNSTSGIPAKFYIFYDQNRIYKKDIYVINNLIIRNNGETVGINTFVKENYK